MRDRQRSCHLASTSGADETGQSVGEVKYRELVFERSQLRDGDFCGADLSGQCFRQADARGARFDGANLSRADFTGALLQGARFQKSCLQDVSFRQALLLSAHLEEAEVEGADFTGANLEWAWIQGVDFQLASVDCALFLNARGLSEATREVIERGGGFTGNRTMILGRELYEGRTETGSESDASVGLGAS